MKKRIFCYTLFTLFLLSVASCKSKLPVIPVTIKSGIAQVVVKAEVAQNDEDRNYGYMNRKNIPDGTGMLFVFEKDQILSFWMKNTPHPLSIAYIDSKGKIRNIYDMTPFSLTPVISTVSVRYALEVPQGWFEKNNIKVGDTVSCSIINN